jgi:hypothetical protein
VDPDPGSRIFLLLDPEWKYSDTGFGINTEIRDKHPGSATLIIKILFLYSDPFYLSEESPHGYLLMTGTDRILPSKKSRIRINEDKS